MCQIIVLHVGQCRCVVPDQMIPCRHKTVVPIDIGKCYIYFVLILAFECARKGISSFNRYKVCSSYIYIINVSYSNNNQH